MDEISPRISLAKPSSLPPRSEVVRLISRHADLLEKGVSVLDVNLRIPSGIPIDVLAVDSRGTLLIVDVFDGKNSSWIAHVLHHLKWVDSNRDFLSKAYGVEGIDTSLRARAVSVVARLSGPAMDALSYLKDVSLSCYRLRCFTAEDGRFLTLESRLSNKPVVKDPLQPVELTKAEIADFLDAADFS